MNPDELLRKQIGSAQSCRELIRALAAYYSVADVNAAGCAASAPMPLACCAGCSYCCYIPVAARAQEILLLAEHIKQRFSADEQARLVQRLRGHVALIASMTNDQQHRVNIPCPLLLNSRCTAYEARPASCRACHSLDVSSCKKTYDDPSDMDTQSPRDPKYVHVWLAMAEMAYDAFEHHGYDQTRYELGSALLEALTKPAVWKRFYQHKKPFLAARAFHS